MSCNGKKALTIREADNIDISFYEIIMDSVVKLSL
jgi:hypothetical protein